MAVKISGEVEQPEHHHHHGAAQPRSNWSLSDDARHKMVNKIMDTLLKHMPPTCTEGMNDLRKIASRFEDKIYTAAADQQDYLRRISLKMLSLETKAQGPGPNPPGTNQQPLVTNANM